MFGSFVLDIAIDIIFIYMLISLICSIVNEWVSRIFSIRSKTLKKWIVKFLQDPGIIQTYIPSEVFAKSLLETVRGYLPEKDIKAGINELIGKVSLPSNDLKLSLMLLVDQTAGSKEFKKLFIKS